MEKSENSEKFHVTSELPHKISSGTRGCSATFLKNH